MPVRLRYSTSAGAIEGRCDAEGRGGLSSIWGGPGEKGMKAKAPPTLSNARCPTCEGEFKRKRKTQRACSRACYLALWHFDELEKAVRAGHAGGLAILIRELKEARR